MSLTATSTTRRIRDARGRALGRFEIEETTDSHWLGTFHPDSDFEKVKILFTNLEELINDGILSLTDNAQAQIELLELTFDDGSPVYDLIIYSDGNASCRRHPWSYRSGKS